MGQYTSLVFYSFVKYFILIVFFFSFLISDVSKTHPNISFLDADCSEEGVFIKEVKTDIQPKKNRNIKGSVQRVFFSFVGEESIFEKIYCMMHYDSNWVLNISKISLFEKTYVINNLKLQNSKGFFIKAEKISNVGKLSALNLETGSSEAMGWKASSKFVNYDAKKNEIIFLDNKFGIGKTKLKFFNLNFSKTPRSGWFATSGLVKDFEEKTYFSFGYYFLSENKDVDFSFYPMFYWKDLGSIFQVRSLKHNIEFNAQIERCVSYARNKNCTKNKQISPSNFVLNLKSNNNFLDAAFYVFNNELYNKKLWKNMNYHNFLHLDKYYWGFAYFNFGILKLNALQRNSKNSLTWILDFSKYFNITAEKTFDGDNFANFNLMKNIYADVDMFLFDTKGKLSYKFMEKEDYTKLDKENLKLSTEMKLDLPIIRLDKNIIKFSVFFNADGKIMDFINCVKKEKKIDDDFILDLGGDCVCSFKDFDLKIFYKNNKRFGLELANFQKYLDSISIEREGEKIFFSFVFLENSKCYGIKIYKDQILLEILYTFSECLKFQFLTSYHFKESFFKKSNLYNKHTYINCGIQLKTKSWQIKIGSGIKNSPEQGVFSIYSISVSLVDQVSFAEIEEIFKDIDKEKEKILSLYDEF
ncbi:hypothetical protein [Alphaproteobacteria bacterium endosymbiont of Tiliacea citrago]|uniref:hypothetical protein n=1 Tax=Alphaproteobacteria bacterium endosymbiont of Tiliacea citrago TaxID=3077944 RepID=UPI00313BF317